MCARTVRHLRWLACAISLGAAEQLPELPRIDKTDFLPAIRIQVDRAEADAGAHPSDAKSVGGLAMTLHAYQQYQSAAQAYERARALDPQNFDWLYLLGAVQVELGRFDDAVASFRSALVLRSSDLPAALRLAQSLTALSNWREADAVYRRILEEHPGCARAWYGLGRVQAALGDHAGAAQSYAKACDLFPPYGTAHFALAAELRKLGNKAEAERQLASYSKNVTEEPPLDDPLFRRIHDLNQSVTVHIRRGAELEKAGKLEEAIREHELALAIDPGNVQVHVNLLSLYGRAGDTAKAKEQFEQAIRLSPGRSDAWYNYGVLLFRGQNDADAEQAFRRAIEINPDYAEAHNNLGAIYQQRGRLDDAAKEFGQAIASQPDYPMARFQLARILVNQQKYGEAIQQLQRAIEPEDDQTPVYLYALAAAYARSGDREHALQYFQRARDRAIAHGQSQLLKSIDRDWKEFRGAP
jgi:tetratricopeptide (TPR) repeat protein